MNITGTGFNSNCTVKMDGIDCSVVSISYNTITCLAPANVIYSLLVLFQDYFVYAILGKHFILELNFFFAFYDDYVYLSYLNSQQKAINM